MIFKNFESTDIVAGRINKVSSGFWVDGNYAVTQSSFTTSSTQVVLTGSNQYDVQNGLYYYNSPVPAAISNTDKGMFKPNVC